MSSTSISAWGEARILKFTRVGWRPILISSMLVRWSPSLICKSKYAYHKEDRQKEDQLSLETQAKSLHNQKDKVLGVDWA